MLQGPFSASFTVLYSLVITRVMHALVFQCHDCDCLSRARLCMEAVHCNATSLVLPVAALQQSFCGTPAPVLPLPGPSCGQIWRRLHAPSPLWMSSSARASTGMDHHVRRQIPPSLLRLRLSAAPGSPCLGGYIEQALNGLASCLMVGEASTCDCLDAASDSLAGLACDPSMSLGHLLSPVCSMMGCRCGNLPEGYPETTCNVVMASRCSADLLNALTHSPAGPGAALCSALPAYAQCLNVSRCSYPQADLMIVSACRIACGPQCTMEPSMPPGLSRMPPPRESILIGVVLFMCVQSRFLASATLSAWRHAR